MVSADLLTLYYLAFTPYRLCYTKTNMKGVKQPFGYTIVEVMIVLAVSGVMFAIAANFISGKQEKASFTQGVNEMASRIQGTINQINDGQYSDIPLSCSYTSSGGIGSTTISAGGGQQGKNSSCVFLGKIMMFAGAQESPPSYDTISLAGGRVDASGTDGAAPTLTLIDPNVITQLTVTQDMPQSLSVESLTLVASDGTINTSALNFGFIGGLGTSNGNGAFTSGAQSIGMVYVTAANATSSVTDVHHHVAYAKSAVLCLTDDTQSAILSVGLNSNSQLDVKTKRLGSNPCP